MDNLLVTGLTAKTRIGIHDWEQQILQTVVVDLELPCDLAKVNDDIDNTIDYAKLSELVTHFIESNNFHLLETLASQLSDLVFSEFDIHQLKLTVSKPNAISNAKNICIQLERHK